MNFYVLSFLFVFLIVHKIFSVEPEVKPATIIYLKGSCSSGKSTLIEFLTFSEKNLEVVDEDRFAEQLYLKAVQNKCPSEYFLIEKTIDQDNIYHSLRTNNFIFKKMAKEEEVISAQKAILEIQEKLDQPENLRWRWTLSQNIKIEGMKKIELALKSNKNVIVDAWYISSEDIQKSFPKNSFVKVMLYCSLPESYKRLLKRNDQAISQKKLNEQRTIGQLMHSFCSLYEINNRPIQPIQPVELTQLTQTFHQIYQNLPQRLPKTTTLNLTELSRQELLALQFFFLQPFESCENKQFFISPKEKQDLIIDNTDMDIKTAANIIKELLK